MRYKTRFTDLAADDMRRAVRAWQPKRRPWWSPQANRWDRTWPIALWASAAAGGVVMLMYVLPRVY